MLTLARTRAFRSFQRSVGNSTFHINAAYIGLEFIARGADKPSNLKIKWTPPKHPKQMVDQSRSFLHIAFLGHIFGALDGYLRDIAADRNLQLSDASRDILSKAVTKPGSEAYSVAERFGVIGECSHDDARADRALTVLAALWRNQTVHEDGERTRKKSRLDESAASELISYKANYATRYGGLDPQILVGHVRAGSSPARKEIVALASAAQNYVRWADGTILHRTFSSSVDLETFALRILRKALLGESDQPFRQLWGKDVEGRARRLTAILQEAGFTDADNELPKLGNDFILTIASLDREIAKARLTA